MLDMHAVSSGGSTTLASISTIASGGDGQTVAGVPIAPNARLVMWGNLVTIADTIREARLLSQDQVDPINGEYAVFGASSLLGSFNRYTSLLYKTGLRDIASRQNTAAANTLGYYVDYYTGAKVQNPAVYTGWFPENQIELSTVGAAKTAITWGADSFAPGTAIPNGKYAILGVIFNALTNYALFRLAHADFGVFKPGFPVWDKTNTAIANAVDAKDFLNVPAGYQFVWLSEKLRVPVQPVFRVTNAGTGLRFETNSITADTPTITIRIARIGDL